MSSTSREPEYHQQPDEEDPGASDMNRPSPPTAVGAPQARGRRRSALRRERRDERSDRCERYAASKWGAAPAACALPPPPTHWRREGRCRPEPDRALPLKLLLNVTA
ncbi:hypothetical protein PYW08_012861 [Mythimna loreyi]|uniref:Uncharacterized protein n=1 Tax=Mythimna loreyi TaxID=667449 RepID=A0ACC2Q4Z7_9NEOP|nr:hypothetical protein PYW08_012861 [Mythimna loreyi]